MKQHQASPAHQNKGKVFFCMNKAHRIWQWLVGTVLITTGVLILCAFHFLARENQETWFDQVGTILIIEAYSIVASLFILVGLRYIFGRKWVIERMIKHKPALFRHFGFFVIRRACGIEHFFVPVSGKMIHRLGAESLTVDCSTWNICFKGIAR
jgi:hypothetical protein